MLLGNGDPDFVLKQLENHYQAIYITAELDPLTVCDLLHDRFSLHAITKSGGNVYIHSDCLETALMMLCRKVGIYGI